jgi:adenine-specific DNA-methyltransferase
MTNNNFETMEEILTPTIFCENQANNYIKITDSDYRKKKGQFFTPPKIAKFMAEISYERGSQTIKILDPGAGAGILTCAICELMASKDNIKVIEVDAYENDTHLANYLQESFNFCKEWLNRFNIKFYYNIIEKDFILDAIEKFKTKKFPTYDIIIGNPPYFKISKNNPQAQEAIEFVYGQPNIYSLFMGVAVNFLNHDGQMVFITPRSYTTGPYFKAFRKIFFGKMKPERVHIFESRTDTFHKDSVLQENIILKARKSNNTNNIEISFSTGINDIEKSPIHLAPLNHVLFHQNGDILFRLPVDEQDDNILIKVDEWTGSLHEFGMKISTGPVVPFRTTEFLSRLSEKCQNRNIHKYCSN